MRAAIVILVCVVSVLIGAAMGLTLVAKDTDRRLDLLCSDRADKCRESKP